MTVDEEPRPAYHRRNAFEQALYDRRKSGDLPRRMQREDSPKSDKKQQLIEAISDRFGVAESLACIYLDWFTAVANGWITPDQAQQETNRDLFTRL